MVEAGRQACFGEILLLTQFSLLHSISGHCCLSACLPQLSPTVIPLRLRDEAMHHRCFGGWGLNMGHSHIVDSQGSSGVGSDHSPLPQDWAKVEDALVFLECRKQYVSSLSSLNL